MKIIKELLAQPLMRWGICVYVVIVVAAVVQGGALWFDFWLIKCLDGLTIVFAFVAMGFAWQNYRANKRGEDKITLSLDIMRAGKTQRKMLTDKLLRRFVSRGEIQGILGNFHASDKRYVVRYTKLGDFDDDIYAVQRGRRDDLIIKIDLDHGDIYAFKDPNDE